MNQVPWAFFGHAELEEDYWESNEAAGQLNEGEDTNGPGKPDFGLEADEYHGEDHTSYTKVLIN